MNVKSSIKEVSKLLKPSNDTLLFTPPKEIRHSSETLSECCGCSKFSAKKFSTRRRLLSTPPNTNSPTAKHVKVTPAVSHDTATTVVELTPNEKDKKEVCLNNVEESSFECQSLSSWSTMTGSDPQLESIDFINFFFENFGNVDDKVLKCESTLEPDLTLCCSPVPWCHDNGTGAQFLTPMTGKKEPRTDEPFRLKRCNNSFDDFMSSSAFESSQSSCKDSSDNLEQFPLAPVNSPNLASDMMTTSSGEAYAKTEHESTGNETSMEINGNHIDCNFSKRNYDKTANLCELNKEERVPCIGQEDPVSWRYNNKYYNKNLLYAESICRKYKRQQTSSACKKKYVRLPYNPKSSMKVYMWLKHMNEHNSINEHSINSNKVSSNKSNIVSQNARMSHFDNQCANSDINFNSYFNSKDAVSPPKKRKSGPFNSLQNDGLLGCVEDNFDSIRDKPVLVTNNFFNNFNLDRHLNKHEAVDDCKHCYLCNKGHHLPSDVNIDESHFRKTRTPSKHIQHDIFHSNSNNFHDSHKFTTHFVDEKYDITYVKENSRNNHQLIDWQTNEPSTEYSSQNTQRQHLFPMNLPDHSSLSHNNILLKQTCRKKLKKRSDITRKNYTFIKENRDYNEWDNASALPKESRKDGYKMDSSGRLSSGRLSTGHLSSGQLSSGRLSSGRLSSGRRRRVSKRLRQFGRLMRKEKTLSRMEERVTMLAVV